MKKRSLVCLAAGALLLTAALAGCGAQSKSSGLKPMNTEGVFPESSVLLEAGGQTARASGTELTGAEVFEDSEMQAESSVYNQPDMAASVIGKLDSGAVVSVAGRTADNGWFKIAYNGRVAYIPADVLPAEANNTPAAPVNNTPVNNYVPPVNNTPVNNYVPPVNNTPAPDNGNTVVLDADQNPDDYYELDPNANPPAGEGTENP